MTLTVPKGTLPEDIMVVRTLLRTIMYAICTSIRTIDRREYYPLGTDDRFRALGQSCALFIRTMQDYICTEQNYSPNSILMRSYFFFIYNIGGGGGCRRALMVVVGVVVSVVVVMALTSTPVRSAVARSKCR